MEAITAVDHSLFDANPSELIAFELDKHPNHSLFTLLNVTRRCGRAAIAMALLRHKMACLSFKSNCL
jgi:hypothetical protein